MGNAFRGSGLAGAAGATGVAALAMTALIGAGCSSNTTNGSGTGTSSQASARDQAASTVCDRMTACGEVGPGKRYESADQCLVKQKSDWDSLWPPQTCDGKIDVSALDTCLSTIRAAECKNGLDVANIVLNKCPSSKVCTK